VAEHASAPPVGLRTPAFHHDPFPVYRVLRDEHPVFFDEERGAYVLTRYTDVRDAARDHARFSSAATRSEVFDRITRMDPPEHDVWRALLAARFRPRRVATVEADVRATARALLLAGHRVGVLEAVEHYAAPIPSTTIGDLIGLDRALHMRCHELSEISIAGAPADAAVANDEIYAMFEPLLAARRVEPADDLVSALLSAEVDGRGPSGRGSGKRPLSHEELLGYLLHLVVAGNDTTANLIATGIVLLAHDPELRGRLVAQPALVPAFIEELLRFDGPVQMLYRATVVPVALHRTTIPAGAVVELYWGAANRDERAFADPDRFVLDRPEAGHVGFGHGVHFCLGAHLARLEARVAFEELLAVAPSYRLAPGQLLERKPGWSIRGYRSAVIELR
jgi:cytochrome P450